MKDVTIWFLLLFMTTSSYSQIKKENIEKGDNIILLESNSTSDSLFILCSKFLIQKGYSFQSRDQPLGQILTNERPYAGAFNYRLNLVFSNRSVKIRAMAQAMTLGGALTWTDWSYFKSKGNLMNEAFHKFHPDILEMAYNLSDTKIFYYAE